MKKINVLHLMSYCPGSGVDIQLSKLAKFNIQSTSGILNLHLLVRHSGGRFDDIQNDFESAFKGDEHFFLFFIRILKTIKNRQIDIIQAHNLKELSVSLLARFFYKVKVVYHVHHYSKFSSFRRNIINFLFKRCDGLIFVSKTLLNDYKKEFPNLSKAFVIYNGVETLGNTKQLQSFSTQDTYKLGTVGSFKPGIRNYKELVKFFNYAFEHGFDAELHIVGGSTDKESERYFLDVQEYSKKLSCYHRLVFWGQVSDVSLHYENFDAFIYNSIGDTFGNAWFEAASRSIPVIINSFPLFKELSAKMNLFFYSSEDEFLQKLLFVKNNTLEDELHRNVQVIANDYSFATCYENFCATYTKLLEA